MTTERPAAGKDPKDNILFFNNREKTGMAYTDVLIHTNNALNEPAAQRVIQTLNQMSGVIKTNFTAEKDHLVMVSYDPNTIEATRLLGVILALGHKAQLVGL